MGHSVLRKKIFRYYLKQTSDLDNIVLRMLEKYEENTYMYGEEDNEILCIVLK